MLGWIWRWLTYEVPANAPLNLRLRRVVEFTAVYIAFSFVGVAIGILVR